MNHHAPEHLNVGDSDARRQRRAAPDVGPHTDTRMSAAPDEQTRLLSITTPRVHAAPDEQTRVMAAAPARVRDLPTIAHARRVTISTPPNPGGSAEGAFPPWVSPELGPGEARAPSGASREARPRASGENVPTIVQTRARELPPDPPTSVHARRVMIAMPPNPGGSAQGAGSPQCVSPELGPGEARAPSGASREARLRASGENVPTIVQTRPTRLARGSVPPAADASASLLSTTASPPIATSKPARVAEEAPPAEVFALIRRIALQRDLADAAAVLHAELGSLVRGRVVLARVSADGVISSPIVGDLRDAAAVFKLGLIAETARRKQRYVAERMVMFPLPTAAAAVLVVWRSIDAPVLEADALRVTSQAAARLGVLDHFLAVAADKQEQAAADRGGVFRAEALAAARETRKDGELVNLSPRIVRVAIPAILVVTAALIAAAAIVKVPSYSRGTIVVKSNGHNVIANAGGRITTVFVTPGQQVAAGDPLIALDTTRERQDFEQIDTVYRDQLSTFLFDTTDEAARQSLAGILAQRKAALDALTAKTITAPVAGAISNVLVSDLVQPGEHVVTIVAADSAPSVLAFMPGSDRSRYQRGMTIQVELTGYPGTRLSLVITEVGTEIMGPATARKFLGAKLADAVALPPSVVLVKAALPAGSFESRGKSYTYFDGMDGIAEIEIDRRSFLSVVIPTGD